MNLPVFRLFVLGAGFSKPAGLPLAKELLSLIRRDVKWHFERGGGWEGTLEQEIGEWTALYPGEQVDLERVLAFSHRKHYLRLRGSDEYFEHGSRSIVAARKAIQRILISATPSVTPQLYAGFVQHLSPNDVVLTFNYDTLLEQALESIAKPYSLTPEWWLSRDMPTSGQEYVDLLKLHGSVDWYSRHYHDFAIQWHHEQGHDVPDRDPIFGPNPLVQAEPLSRGSVEVHGQRLLPQVFRVPNHSNHFPFEEGLGSYVVPFVLPLAHDKLLGHDAILDLWENLHRTMDSYSAIIMIGYSMPSYDSYAYEALGRLFVDYQQGGDTTYWGQRRVPIQLITKADSEQSALRDIPFLDHHRTRVWHEGFSDESLSWIDWGDGAQ